MITMVLRREEMGAMESRGVLRAFLAGVGFNVDRPISRKAVEERPGDTGQAVLMVQLQPGDGDYDGEAVW